TVLADRLINVIRTIALVAKPCQRGSDCRARSMVNGNRTTATKMKTPPGIERRLDSMCRGVCIVHNAFAARRPSETGALCSEAGTGSAYGQRDPTKKL